jgi:hypothetical protein
MKNVVLAQEDEARRRGVLEPLNAPQPQASLPATGGALAPTSSGAPIGGLPGAGSACRCESQVAA